MRSMGQLVVTLGVMGLGIGLLAQGWRTRSADGAQAETDRAAVAALAQEVAEQAGPLLVAADAAGLQDAIEDWVRRRQLAYVALYDAEGVFLGAGFSQPDIQLAFADRLIGGPVVVSLYDCRRIRCQGPWRGQVYEAACPIEAADAARGTKRLVGAVRLARPSRGRAMQAGWGWSWTWTLGLVLISGTAGVCWGRHRALRPLERLLNEVRQYQQADGSGRSWPEAVRAVAGELHRLTGLLRQSRSELHETRQLVDRRVDHRTRELRRHVRQLERLSTTDGLTGLVNRRGFEEVLTELFVEARAGGGNLACGLIDIDYFKQINDSWGHDAGDEVIKFVGELLGASMRERDVAARLGGDEFITLWVDCEAGHAAKRLESLRRMYVREVPHVLPAAAGDDLAAGLSIGVVDLRLGNSVWRPEHLVKLADAALYDAKGAGRNRVRLYCEKGHILARGQGPILL